MNTLIIGHKIIRLDSVNSTNSFLSENLNNISFFEGIVVVADTQTQGRGQGDNLWHSKLGDNLLFSVLLQPKCDLIYQFYLNQFVAVSICQTLKLFGLDCHIKWPNDILVDDKKIAGILIENKIQGRMLHSSIVGVGLNINQSKFPDQLVNPTSMNLLLKELIDKELVLKALIVQIEKHYFQFKRNELVSINDSYQSLLYKRNEKALFRINGNRVEAFVKEVNKQGEIVLEINKELKSFSNSEIKMIKE
ncbi:biotin--[acetyl-CoA-carboxylase] ligase [Flavobacteriales bacterium]|nr:biotin--[acetyl-CoA-carboxylase] ligase [Flavobacteriales bacterium]